MQPLHGILVLDFSTLLPGPLATLMLAEAGAEVIKIERPGGEEMRQFPPTWEGESATFAMLNRGKQVVALDLKQDADREKLRPLLERADVIVEQFRPGVMARLGLGFDDVRKINPRIVYCSISGYGQSGQGVHLDIAMTDAMFTFAWYALALGQASGRFPGAGELRLTGASPRYQLYPTRDGRLIACGALEQKFWDAFTR